MALFVQKFGGTSVGSIERIEAVADTVIKTIEAGHRVAVVLSAMSGETNRLLELADEISSDNDPREVDVLVTTGEQVSIALLALVLKKRGYAAKSYTGWQIPMLTDTAHGRARIVNIKPDKLHEDLDSNVIPVIAGFQGINEHGHITTLGRGGSDTTAVAIAAALDADECQIFTDVDGVYTTDPRIEPKARKMHTVTFEEMLELASLGAKVLQIRAVEFAGKYNVPLRVLSSFASDGEGTLITYEDKENAEAPLVSGIAYSRNEAQIRLRNIKEAPDVAYKILAKVSAANIDVDMIVQNDSKQGFMDLTFTVQRQDYQRAMDLIKHSSDELGTDDIKGEDNIAKVSIVGVGMKSHAGVAAKLFEILAAENILVRLISTSEIKVSVVIEEKYLELAVRQLHAGFELEKVPFLG